MTNRKSGVDVIERYIDAAAKHGAATDRGDHRTANAAYDDVLSALSEIRRFPDRGQSVLKELLNYPNSHVKIWAATHLLPLDEEAAIRALSALVSEPPFVGINARMVLREWKAGRLKIPE